MLVSPDILRFLLAVCLVGMALLAFLFLRRRRLTSAESLAWGLLIVFVPLLGPFLVIVLRPGMPLRESQPHIKPRSGSIP
jgi:hypothetical protein